MNAAVHVKDMSVSAFGQTILRDVNLDVAAGSFTWVVGANGSGKTTLIRTILGLIEQTAGTVMIGGKLRTQQVIAQQVGYVPQYNSIDRRFPITVKEMIELACTQGPACPTDPVGHLRTFDAEQLVDRSLEKLSGGEFQKVLIARALVNDPGIVILDEPVNNLDQESQDTLLAKLKQLNSMSGKTVIIISHDHHLIGKQDSVLLVAEKTVTASSPEKVLHMEELHHRDH
ncbi:MAG: Zinc import ATP-binding protein ZnuC [candidate division WS6 bacterium OLB20]|uniref:Zinc import ATP-binding protein ZnuC n=1 Tax=candidate division WS6 bacterium OLB20 TaxID=1617426 RepID=A0A136LYU0_9BACT|nr:MAG: Zinc import ATP-binding protein ZnuC [candidate division WS6 bacterium OLB20]